VFALEPEAVPPPPPPQQQQWQQGGQMGHYPLLLLLLLLLRALLIQPINQRKRQMPCMPTQLQAIVTLQHL
jgi:hypothetical protein